MDVIFREKLSHGIYYEDLHIAFTIHSVDRSEMDFCRTRSNESHINLSGLADRIGQLYHGRWRIQSLEGF